METSVALIIVGAILFAILLMVIMTVFIWTGALEAFNEDEGNS